MKKFRSNLRPGLLLVLLILMIAPSAQANIQWRDLQKISMPAEVLDVTASADGALVFALTPGQIVVYAMDSGAITDRLSVDPKYDRITYAETNRLVLTSRETASLRIVQYDRIWDIDLSNRPSVGPVQAKVTLAVFDDYQ